MKCKGPESTSKAQLRNVFFKFIYWFVGVILCRYLRILICIIYKFKKEKNRIPLILVPEESIL